MAAKITQTEEIKKFLNVVSGMTSDKGNPRVKEIVHRILTDLFNTIEDLDVRPHEFWATVDYFNDLGQHMEAGLLTPGLGLEHFLDLRMDAEDETAGVKQGTPRTIEGPLYVANAPLSKANARLDDGTDKGEVLFMHGVVRDMDGKPVAGAIVDVWHANTKGMYSFFDKSQSKYKSSTAHRNRFRRSLRIPYHRACRLWLSARRTDPAFFERAWSAWPAAGAHSFLRIGAGTSSPYDPDQHRRGQVPVRRLRFRNARGAYPKDRPARRREKDEREGIEYTVLGNRIRLHPDRYHEERCRKCGSSAAGGGCLSAARMSTAAVESGPQRQGMLARQNSALAKDIGLREG
jgi:Catechol dioxygenase N terminus/Dioxygenase